MVSLFIHAALCCSCCRGRDDEDIDEVGSNVKLEEARPAIIGATKDVSTSSPSTDDGIKDTIEKDDQESSIPPITGTQSMEDIEQKARKIISRMFDNLSKQNENGV